MFIHNCKFSVLCMIIGVDYLIYYYLTFVVKWCISVYFSNFFMCFCHGIFLFAEYDNY